MKKVTIAILILLVIAGTAFGAYKLGSKKTVKQISPTPVQVTPTATPSPLPENVGAEIQILLAEKYNKPTDEVHITITKQAGLFVSGSVLFGQGGPGEAGLFLARKTGNKWELAYDGNGSIDCTKMRQVYGFTDEILKPNFCD